MSSHVPVLLAPAISLLNIREDGIYVDMTLGAGGHSEAILKKLNRGHLYAFEQDPEAIQEAGERLVAYRDRLTIIDSNFRDVKNVLKGYGVAGVDGMLFDLGVSSMQFDQAKRGFSYRYDARLDMRMDPRQEFSAYELVNFTDQETLADIIFRYGEERYARAIARKIVAARQINPVTTTFELVEIIKSALPAKALKQKGHPAKKTFQALRIAVNDELGALDQALRDGLDLLKIKGRMAVITFHSLEDRLVKKTFQKVCAPDPAWQGLPDIPEDLKPQYELVTHHALQADETERAKNRRSHSAKLRVIERKVAP